MITGDGQTDEQSGKVDASVMATLRAIAEPRTYPPGTILTRQGATEETFYVIESGCTVVSRELDGGAEQILNTLGPNDSFGELALLDNSPRLATVKTVSETTVLEITAERFKQLLREEPELALHISRRVLANLRKLDRLAIDDLRAKNVLLQEAYRDLQAAQAELVEKERLEHELHLAAEMQRSLLPHVLPDCPDYRFASYLAQARQVGGDLFDVQALDEEHIALLIADVADKGMYAALLMAVTRTLFYQEMQHSLSPAEVVHAVHRGLMAVGGAGSDYGNEAFVTAFYAVLHRPTGRLTYVRAAQDRPLLLRPGQPPESLAGDGRFLGMIDGLYLSEYSATLRPGDYLLLFSDGVVDAHNRQAEQYGLERLKAAFQDAGRGPALDALAGIVADVQRWQGDAPPFDDVTMLLVEVTAG